MTALRRLVFSSFCVATLLIPAAVLLAASPNDSDAVGTFSSQPGAKAPPSAIRGQPEDDRTLEIAPQPGALVPEKITPQPGAPEKSVQEIPAEKAYTPSEKTASLDKKYNPLASEPGSKPKKLPYLGISVEYTLKCYLGQEEHGLEIIKIDPDSPAESAELKGRGKMTPLGAAGVTAGALLGPLELAVVPLLQKAGQLGQDGDLIVAVDDHRVRSELDLEDELAKLKPGDTMYLTVIRPLPSGAHKTMKIAVKVGDPDKLASRAPVAPPSSTEEYAY
jgi:hypothetical protein